MKDQYDIEKFIQNNPMDADCLEDLYSWTADKFRVKDESLDDLWKLVRRLQPGLPK
jgi:hypothetical protein